MTAPSVTESTITQPYPRNKVKDYFQADRAARRRAVGLIFHRHNDIVVLMIPPLVSLGPPTPWAILPPGVYEASLGEVERVFTFNDRRKQLFEGFASAANELAKAGCETIYLDGSFVTAKPSPGDFDACWDTKNVDPKLLHPVLLDFSGRREAQKQMFHGELFPVSPSLDDLTFLDFFQIEKISGRQKGILRLKMKSK